MVLELGHDDDVAGPEVVEAPRVGDEVERLGPVAREDDLPRRGRVDEARAPSRARPRSRPSSARRACRRPDGRSRTTSRRTPASRPAPAGASARSWPSRGRRAACRGSRARTRGSPRAADGRRGVGGAAISVTLSWYRPPSRPLRPPKAGTNRSSVSQSPAIASAEPPIEQTARCPRSGRRARRSRACPRARGRACTGPKQHRAERADERRPDAPGRLEREHEVEADDHEHGHRDRARLDESRG